VRAVVMTPAGDGRPAVVDRPDPEPGAGEILVRVRAAGVNNADLLQAAGRYPAPPGSPPDILGLELAGEVAAVGPGADRFSIGDRVMAVVGGGGQASHAIIHERAAMPVPKAVPWPEAGAFPEVFTTAHDALFTQAGLGPGERICIHGAAGGVGSAAVQLAATAGAQVVATVRRESLRREVEALGPRVTAIDPADFTERGPFDVILELIGGPNLADDLAALATGGRIVVIGVGAGTTADIDLRVLMARRARIHASTLRSRPLEDKALAARSVESHVTPLLADGRIRVPIAATFRLEDAVAAYDRFAEGGKLGKVVLLVD
jgi:NADPH2:quinone reductase